MTRLAVVAVLVFSTVGCRPAPGSAEATCVPGPTSHGWCPDGQVCGSTGCRPCEVSGECGDGQRCCAGACTATAACGACTADVQCGDGRVCCDGQCAAGDCCSAAQCDGRKCVDHRCAAPAVKVAAAAVACTDNRQCLEGEACVGGRCGACSADAECGEGARCCGGRCAAGDCCADADCPDGAACQGHSCSRCTSDVDCGANARCCGGACVPGDCCGAGDCLGRVCRQHQCQACESSAQCGAGQVCCGGLCKAGECCGTPDCDEGQVCRAGRCSACQGDLECGVGARCVQGACVADPACGATLDCNDGMCSVIPVKTGAVRAPGQSCTSTANCGFAEVCCNNRCVSGECCANGDCAALGYPPTVGCIGNACQACTSDAQCGAGQVCCNGACKQGTCCPGQLCPSGQVCAFSQCTACTTSAQCGAGRVCCNGACKDGNCCTTSQCGQYVCFGNQCNTCGADGDCGPGGRCCNGACTTNQCCSRADCPAGKTCLGGQCAACTNNAQCGVGSVCCGGTCKAGNCCTTGDCTGGRVCGASGRCSLCTSDAQCSAGQKCCGGACVNGSCCADADCGVGKVCTNNSCTACTTDAQCGRGSVCCNGGCQAGNCCAPTDGGSPATPSCGGLVCIGSTCTTCTGDKQCGEGNTCCRGACYQGKVCCEASDCGGGQACVNNACVACTSNADCGALSCCDEDGAGPLTGRCQAFCSVTQVFNTKETFDEGTYTGTTAAGSNINPACVPGVLCWAGEAVVLRTPYIWVPSTGSGTALRYNTDTGALEGEYLAGVVDGWPTSSGAGPGDSVSRTSVNPFDSTVWVASRGLGRGRSGVAHLDLSGNVLCYAPVPGVARAMATDALGNAWVGDYNSGTMTQFSGTEVEPGTESPRRCKRLLTATAAGNPYGAAVDNNNNLWVVGGCCGNGVSVSKISANTGTLLDTSPVPCGPYGITVDRDYVWIGCYGSSGIARLTKSSGAWAFQSTGGNPRGIASSSDGFVYAADNGSSVIRMNRQTMQYSTINVGLSQVIAVAVDGAGKVWAIDYYGPLVRMNGDGSNQVVVGAGGRNQYTYTDLTGQQTINAGLTPGLWAVTQDSNYLGSPSARWTRLNFTLTKPANTSVSARVKVASTRAGLDSAPWWNGQTVPGVPGEGYREEASGVVRLDDITLPRARFIRIEVKLTTSSDTITPVVRSVSATWTP